MDEMQEEQIKEARAEKRIKEAKKELEKLKKRGEKLKKSERRILFLSDIRKDIYTLELGHDEAAQHYETMHYVVGIPLVSLTTLIGASIFTAFEEIIWLKVSVVLISAVATVLAGLQTFLRYAERAGRHRMAKVNCHKMNIELSEFFIKFSDPETTVGDWDDFISNIRRKYEELITNSPQIPRRMRERAIERKKEAELPQDNF